MTNKLNENKSLTNKNKSVSAHKTPYENSAETQEKICLYKVSKQKNEVYIGLRVA